jgi:WD40 repeat protein/transcriptional regulator with XRE-family HTH domain
MGAHHPYRERRYAFGQQLLTLRTRAGLTQVTLASLIGVHRRSVQNWETGESYPKAEVLRRLIAIFLSQGVFAAGKEEEEASRFWEQARQDGPHPLATFDAAWFAQLLAQHSSTPIPRQAPSEMHEEGRPRGHSSALVHRRGMVVDWGEAIAVPTLHGREDELATLQRWLVDERCRVVALLGLGGMGKSSLAITIAHQVLAQFDVVLFRSLQNGPPLEEVLGQIIRAVSDPQATLPSQLSDSIAHLVQLLRERRCLLILDNLETLMASGVTTGTYRSGYAEYGELLRALSEREHQSCLLLTSREKPSELAPYEGRNTPVRTLPLTGLDERACQRILEDRDITGTADQVTVLARLYGGNPLALQLVSEPIRELFAGDVGAFLEPGDVFVGGTGNLLDEHLVRSTPLEQAILYWLAIEREPVPLIALVAVLGKAVPQREVLAALQSLRRRMLVERAADQPIVALQPVILEYMTDRLVEAVHRELVDGQPQLLCSHALVQATAKDYVRRSQEHLIATPLLERAVGADRNRDALEHQLLMLLAFWREGPRSEQGYGPGNVVNLLRLLRGHLRDLDLAHLTIRQAYMQGVALQDSSLVDSAIQDSIFTEAFDVVPALTISSGGAYWASGSRRGEVRVWARDGLTLHRAWQAHAEQVCAITLSPDGHLVATCGSWDGRVKLWEIASGALLWSSQPADHVSIVAFAPDGSILASAGDGAFVQLLEVRSGTLLETLTHPDPVSAVAWCPDQRLLATGDQQGRILIWAVSATALLILVETLPGHSDGVEGLAFSPDGSILASGSWDGTIKLWDVSPLRGGPSSDAGHESVQAGLRGSSTRGSVGATSDHLRRTLIGHTERVNRVAWSPDGRTLASSSLDQTIWLWDVERGNNRRVLHGHTAGVKGLAFTSDGRSLLSGGEDGTLRLWDVTSGQCIRVVQGYGASLYDVDWSPDGTRLASGGSDAVVTIYTIAPVSTSRVLRGHSGVVLGVGWSSKGRLLATSEWDNTIRVWDTSSGACLQVLHHPDNVVNFFDGLGWSPDGRYLATGASAGGVLVWDLEGGVQTWVGRDSPVWIRHMAWSPDSTRLAGGGDDGSIWVWDVTNDVILQKLVGHSSMVTRVAWNLDGTLLASSGGSREAGELFVWNLERGKRVQSMAGPPNMVYAVAWGPEGDILVSGDSDGALRWWDVQRAVCVRVRHAHQGRVQSLKRSPDGTRLASCGDDGAILLWDLRHGDYLQTLRRDRPYERVDITGLAGLTEAQRASLIALGAVEQARDRAAARVIVPVSDTDEPQRGDRK